MSTTTLAAPIRINPAAVNARPGIGRLVAVELRKIVDTRAGFWMQVATVALTAIVVIVRLAVGDAADHTFGEVLKAGILPAGVLLPVAGILLVTSEWSQRTGTITFALVPQRGRVVGAKILASLALGVAIMAISVAIIAAGVLAAASGVDGAWSDAGILIGQTAVYLLGGMLTGVGFGMVLLASAPAIVALFALPIAWTGVTALPALADAGPWTDTRLALGELPHRVVTGTEWAQAGTALALWMLLPLLIGAWRITRREVRA